MEGGGVCGVLLKVSCLGFPTPTGKAEVSGESNQIYSNMLLRSRNFTGRDENQTANFPDFIQ